VRLTHTLTRFIMVASCAHDLKLFTNQTACLKSTYQAFHVFYITINTVGQRRCGPICFHW